jgi:hypothetical protein
LTDDRAWLPALEHQVEVPLTVRASYGRPFRTIGLKPDIRASERPAFERNAPVHRRDLRPTLAAPGEQEQKSDHNRAAIRQQHGSKIAT